MWIFPGGKSSYDSSRLRLYIFDATFTKFRLYRLQISVQYNSIGLTHVSNSRHWSVGKMNDDVHVMCFGHYHKLFSLLLFYKRVIQYDFDACKLGSQNLVLSLGCWQLLGSLSWLWWRDVIYILNDAMNCNNNNNELTASGSKVNGFHMFYSDVLSNKNTL